MFNKKFDHNIIRKTISAFGTLFNDTHLVRYNSNGSVNQTIKVPIEHSQKQQWFSTVVLRDYQTDDEVKAIFPRMGFAIDTFEYDPERKLKTMDRIHHPNTSENQSYVFNAVPYNINMELYLAAKSQSDAFQLLSGILPYFTPSFTLTSNMIPALGIQDDIRFVLESVSYEKEYEGELTAKEIVAFTLRFKVKVNFYSHISTQELIRRIQTDIYVPPGSGPVTDEEISNTPRSSRITVVPDPESAEPTDTYGYKTTREFFTDGKKYDPVSGTDIDISPDVVVLIPTSTINITTYPPTIVVSG